MSRLIDVPDAAGLATLAVGVGDVLLVRAAGGRVESGTAVELVGVFVDAVVGTGGDVLAPAGGPTAVLFRARRPGRAVVAVVDGGFGGPLQQSVLAVTVTA